MNGLNTNVELPPPPQRIPINRTFVVEPGMIRKTGDPLSPGPTPAMAMV